MLNEPRELSASATCRRAIYSAIEDFGMNMHGIEVARSFPGTETAWQANEAELRRRLALVRTKLDEAALWFESAMRIVDSEYPLSGTP